MSDKTLRRLPLRQLLASSDKAARELADMMYTNLLPRIADFRDLSRPVRRKSQFPTLIAFNNGLRRMLEAHDQITVMLSVLHEHLDAIRDHAQKEKLNRKI
jgi:hypothetical protein